MIKSNVYLALTYKVQIELFKKVGILSYLAYVTARIVVCAGRNICEIS